MEWLRRLAYWAQRRRREEDLAREMAFHREMLDGPIMGEAAAQFGNELRLREDAREVWGWTWIDRLWQDLVYGGRILRSSPAFTLTAALTLALGIGVTLTMVRVAIVQIRPNVPDPDTLVHLTRRSPISHQTSVAVPMLEFYRTRARSFRAVVGEFTASAEVATAPGAKVSEPERIVFVTGDYFGEMGLHALHGRLLDPAIDERPDAEPVAVMGQAAWERLMGGDTAAVGRMVWVDGKPLRVVGVVDRKDRIAVWAPLRQQPYVVEGSTLLTDWSKGLTMHARLAPGVRAKASEAETKALAAVMRSEQPQHVMQDEWLDAEPASHVDPEMYTRGLLAAALILLVLVVACTNLGTLLMARGVTREREIAIRLALGAGRRRIVRQLFTESLLLAALGCVGALILSSLAVRILQAQLGDIGAGTAPDWRVLVATLVIGLLAALSFGLAPALRLTGTAPGGGRARTIFVAVQVAASCLLLMLSGLLVRSYERLSAVDVGFDFRHMAMVEPHLDEHGYKGGAALGYLRHLRERLLGMPGVERVSIVWLPVWGNMASENMVNGQRVSINRVDREFLSTVGLRLVRGRNFEPGEENVTIVSEPLARWLWPGEDPLGKKLNFTAGTVIGVVRQADTFRLRTETLGMYYPLTEKEAGAASLVVRTAASPRAYLGQFTAAVKAMDGRLLPGTRALDREYEEAFRSGVTLVTVIGGLGMLATLIAAIGLAGLTGYTVGQRTREIGIRMALGARGGQVVRGVLWRLFRPVLMGFFFGMLGAGAVAATMSRQIYGLRPLDAVAYAAAIGLFTAVILLATAAPARQAMRVNPADALRHE